MFCDLQFEHAQAGHFPLSWRLGVREYTRCKVQPLPVRCVITQIAELEGRYKYAADLIVSFGAAEVRFHPFHTFQLIAKAGICCAGHSIPWPLIHYPLYPRGRLNTGRTVTIIHHDTCDVASSRFEPLGMHSQNKRKVHGPTEVRLEI